MHTWTPITTETINTYLLPQQLSALQQNGAYLPEIIVDTIARVRSEIAGNANNTFSPDPSLIPIELKTSTCHLIIEVLQSRIPSLKLTEDQIRNANNARSYLRRIAESEIPINHPDYLCEQTKIDIARTRQQRIATYKNLLGL